MQSQPARWRFPSVRVSCLIFILCAPALGGVAQAQSLTRSQLRAAEQVLDLDREAMDLFSQLEFELAKRSLTKALATAETAKLSEHPVATRCHLHLAFVTLVGLKDDVQALVHLQRALAVDPELTVSEDQRRPEFMALLAKARGAGAADAGEAEEEAENEPEVPTKVAAKAAPPVANRSQVVAAAYASDGGLGQEMDGENPLETTTKAPRGPDLSGRFWLGLGLGTGVGYAEGDGLEAYKEYDSAFTPGMTTSGGGHVLPEFGWQFARHWAASISGRHQLLRGSGDRMARGANAALLKLTLMGSGRFLLPMASVGLGAGEGFRLLVQARADGRTFQDTVRGGPAIAMAGLGAGFLLSRSIIGVVEANALAGVPIFSLAFDFNVAVRFYL